MMPRGRPAIHVRPVGPDEFFGDPSGWDDLVASSGADPLFMGHAWLSSWWSAFGPRYGLEPVFLEACCDGDVVGRMAMVRSRQRRRGVMVTTIELLGNYSRGPATMRSEFLDLLARRELRTEVGAALLDCLAAERDWDELVLKDISATGQLASQLAHHPLGRFYVVGRREETSFAVELRGTFEEFKASLSSSARRRMFGQRSKAGSVGELWISADSFAFGGATDHLERLHKSRWGAPLLSGGRREFLTGLCLSMSSARLEVSLLHAGPQVISALLNVDGGEQVTNIQGGFDAAAMPGISPARLHWGLLIEQAFGIGRPRRIDLLLGSGRKDDFKRDFSVEDRVAWTACYIRSTWLAALYRAWGVARFLKGGRT